MKRKGFTLIELLVVIAIIAILASILFPVFSRVREKARQASCMSNLKNLGLALRMYSQDYDERLPASDARGQGGPWPNPAGGCNFVSLCGWAYQAMAYIKSEQVLLCPNYGIGNFVRTTHPESWLTSYWFSNPLINAHEAEIAFPANKVMLYDCLPYHESSLRLDFRFHQMNSNNPKPGWTEIITFADGHAKLMNMTNSIGAPFSCGASPGVVNKWNLNTGWHERWRQTPQPTDCATDPSPAFVGGRQGVNF